MQPTTQQDNSRKILAIALIVFGFVLILKQSGAILEYPFIHLKTVFLPVQNAFQSVGHIIFSWPAIFVLVGLILMAGRRSVGVVLLVIGGIFLLPKLFFISGAALLLFLPLLLIAVGIAIVARIL